jgi:hypothetical protein
VQFCCNGVTGTMMAWSGGLAVMPLSLANLRPARKHLPVARSLLSLAGL